MHLGTRWGCSGPLLRPRPSASLSLGFPHTSSPGNILGAEAPSMDTRSVWGALNPHSPQSGTDRWDQDKLQVRTQPPGFPSRAQQMRLCLKPQLFLAIPSFLLPSPHLLHILPGEPSLKAPAGNAAHDKEGEQTRQPVCCKSQS